MAMKLKLIYYDDEMERQEVEVTTSRFAFGRHDDNDFIIDDPNLSRRHALIEDYDGVYFLSDCGSQNGTTLNGRPVSGPAQINNGDMIKLGGSFEMRVEVVKEEKTQQETKAAITKNSSSVATKKTSSTNQTISSTTSGLSVTAIQVLIGVIVISFAVVIGTAVVVVVVPGSHTDGNINTDSNNNEDANIGTTSTPVESPTEGPTPANTNNKPLDNQQNVPIENVAKKAVKQMSSDEAPYNFPDNKTLVAINAKLDSFRNSSHLSGALKRLSSSDISAQAGKEALPPALAVYTALALTDGGRNGDPVAKATEIIPKLSAMNKMFGSSTGDSSLIVVAAFTENITVGKDGRPYHPLLSRMTELVPTALKDRNVWFLHEHRTKAGTLGISDTAYDLVLNTIALGAIAQNPKQFGIDAPALMF